MGLRSGCWPSELASKAVSLDVLIIGQVAVYQDLWAFQRRNSGLFLSSGLPLSSVGHGTDTTLADFVADRRACDSTALAELAAPVTKLDHLQDVCSSRKARNRKTAYPIARSFIIRQLNKLTVGYLQIKPGRLYDSHLQSEPAVRLNKIREYCSESSNSGSKSYQHRLILNRQSRSAFSEQTVQLERLLRSNMSIYDNRWLKSELSGLAYAGYQSNRGAWLCYCPKSRLSNQVQALKKRPCLCRMGSWK